MSQVIWTRRLVEVNTDPQRRCYNGAHFSSELQWTAWEELESMKFLKPGVDPQDRLKFWHELNDYSVSVGGVKREYELREEEEEKTA